MSEHLLSPGSLSSPINGHDLAPATGTLHVDTSVISTLDPGSCPHLSASSEPVEFWASIIKGKPERMSRAEVQRRVNGGEDFKIMRCPKDGKWCTPAEFGFVPDLDVPPLPPPPEAPAIPGPEVRLSGTVICARRPEDQQAKDAPGTLENSTNSTFSTPPQDPSTPDNSTNSTNSLGERIHEAILPENTILTDYLEYARKLEESADCYLLGSILAVVAAVLARTVWFQLGAKRIFPNLFVILVGKPGDRKSSAINLAYQLARDLLVPNRFLPPTGSAEAYFDEYDPIVKGCPDKFLICDEANSLLSTWKNTSYGENVESKFLSLYDCGDLTETFKRNLRIKPQDPKADPSPRRHIPETSTSVLLGATHNAAKFDGQQARAGLQRRFLYYVADHVGRILDMPQAISPAEFTSLKELFQLLINPRPAICCFTPGSSTLWSKIRAQVKAESDAIDGGAPDGEAILARLSSQPVQVLKVAMCFQACRAAKTGAAWDGAIEEDILDAAMRHVQLCHDSAGYLDTLGRRAEIGQQAEVIHSVVTRGGGDDEENDAPKDYVIVSKSDLTAKFCHHDRRGALRPFDLYQRIIPELIRQGKVIEEPKQGKLQRYRFLLEES